MAEEWVRIIHPETGNTAEVAPSALPFHYQSGWRLLADDEAAGLEEQPVPEPEPVTREQAAAMTAETAATADPESEEE